MVPLRAIGEALGAKIDWHEGTRTVRFTKGEKEVLFVIDQTTALVNGKMMEMDTSPLIKNSRTLLPLRYVGEFLGAEVDWLGQSSTVKIN